VLGNGLVSTGFPDADARDDFNRVRRQRALAHLLARTRARPGAVEPILLFDEVTRALGRVGQRPHGLQVVRTDSIVGTVDRDRDYDRQFRPTSNRARERWERIDAAMRRGEALPPVDVYRVGELHFVRDGHHRVSVARALGHETIDAYVTEVLTAEPPPPMGGLDDLPLIDYRRIFHERAPLRPEARDRIQLRDPWDYAVLAEGIEAWGFRRSQQHGELLDRARTADLWFDEEYVPVVELLVDAGLTGGTAGGATETEAYLRLSAERYRLLRSHAWTEDVIDRLRQLRPGESGSPPTPGRTAGPGRRRKQAPPPPPP